MDSDPEDTQPHINPQPHHDRDTPQNDPQPDKSAATLPSFTYPPSLAKILNLEQAHSFAPEDLVNDIMSDSNVMDCVSNDVEPSEIGDGVAEDCPTITDDGTPAQDVVDMSLLTDTSTGLSGKLEGDSDDKTSGNDSKTGEDVSLSAKSQFLWNFEPSKGLIPSLAPKRPRSPTDNVSFVSSSAGSIKNPAKKKFVVESIFGPTGIGKSAKVLRETRDAAKHGKFVVNRAKERGWRKKIEEADPRARFFEDDVVHATHFLCGKTITVKEPYDTTRFQCHVEGCRGNKKKANVNGRSHNLLEMLSMGRWGSKSVVQKKPYEPTEKVPCQGLTEADHNLIPIYLKRSTAKGGGARSVTAIALERFQKKFRKLPKKDKDIVDNIQQLEHQWRNNHLNLRVFSTACEHWINNHGLQHCKKCHLLLSNNKFIIMLRKPTPTDENFIYVNRRFRDSILGEQYVRTKGLKNLVESAVC